MATLCMLLVLTRKKSKMPCILIFMQVRDSFVKIRWLLMPEKNISFVLERIQQILLYPFENT